MVFYLTVNHEDWREGTGPVTASQPDPKGGKASPQGNHEVVDDKGISHETSLCREVSAFQG